MNFWSLTNDRNAATVHTGCHPVVSIEKRYIEQQVSYSVTLYPTRLFFESERLIRGVRSTDRLWDPFGETANKRPPIHRTIRSVFELLRNLFKFELLNLGKNRWVWFSNRFKSIRLLKTIEWLGRAESKRLKLLLHTQNFNRFSPKAIRSLGNRYLIKTLWFIIRFIMK